MSPGRLGEPAVVVTGLTAIALSVGLALVVSHRSQAPASHAQQGSYIQQSSPDAGPVSHARHSVHASLSSRPSSYLGVYAATSPGSYRQVLKFGRAIGREPNIALYFSTLTEPFQTKFAEAARAHGATVAVQIAPEIGNTPVSLKALAAGHFDSLLRAYADQVAAFGHAVIVGFAHEPNGWWYPWGENDTKPAVWIAAWRHLVNVFRRAGADNVTWLWTMNLQSPSTRPISEWWPGRSYVTWIGLDGYYTPGYNFASIFGSAIHTIRRVSKAPILLAETAVTASEKEVQQLHQVRNLFTAIRKNGYLGFIWFDKDTPRGAWRLDNNQPLLRVFRQEAAHWRLEHAG